MAANVARKNIYNIRSGWLGDSLFLPSAQPVLAWNW
jgi:hypothetical protein